MIGPSARFALAIVAGAATCAGFADDRPASADFCAAIEIDADRLGCYDALFRTPTTDQQRSAELESASEQNPAPTKAKEPATQINALVVQIGKTSSGRQTYHLDNDQIWVKTTDRPFTIREGDLVTIRPGRFGSFSLSTPRNARTRSVS